MKKAYVLLFMFIVNCYISQNIISVNDLKYVESSYSMEELIKKVLISDGYSDCVNVENVVFSPNLNYKQRNYGYFNKENTGFPFKEGLFLSTGYASSIGNMISSVYSSNVLGNGGDMDLIKALQAENPGISISKMFDSSYIEFDFVPLKDEISFNYLLASSEYTKSYPCSYTDGFALLLKKVEDADYVNLAVLPDNTPVSVTNIRPKVGTYCLDKNIEFYAGAYKELNGIPKSVGNYLPFEMNFTGRTIPLTAKAKVEPFVKYHFKFVIADYLDPILDSAVFLEGGSLNLSVKITDKNGIDLDKEVYKCKNEQISLFAKLSSQAKYLSFKWYYNGVLLSGANTYKIDALNPGIYTVVAVPDIPGNQTCSVTTSVEVKDINQSLKILGNLEFCKGKSTILSTDKIYSKYSWSNGQSIISTQPTCEVTEPGTYTLRIKNDKGCDAVSSVQVEEYPALNPEIKGNLKFCKGKTTILSTDKIYSKYSWSNGHNVISTESTCEVTEAGKYTLKVIDKNDCEGAVSVQVEEYSELNPEIKGKLKFCKGKTTILSTDKIYSKYSWSNGHNVISTEPTCEVTEAGKYTLKVIDKNDCEGAVSVQVEEYPEPNPQVIGNLTYCQGGFTELQGNDGYVKYTWSGPNIKGESPNRIHKVDQPGKYTLKVIDKNGCEGVVSVKVDENKIDVHIIGEKEFCEGDRLTLSSNKVFESYEWSDGINTLSNKSEFVVTKSGTYYLTVRYKGCTKITQITVKAIPYPTISQVIVSSIEGKAEVIVYPKGNYIYSLDSFTWQSSNIFESLNVGFYKVWVKTLLGCTSGPFNFKITDIPNIITPNGDGINDIWKLKNLSVGTQIQIYNRYGKLLFEKQVINKDEIVEWNGKYLGRKVESSSYWYVITLTNGKKITGWIAVRNYNELD
ncbi:T9SS type B sorting domain-containing protein [Apibacter adventoris]|nr:T9SS type B sorting domain-containing protein [Apibacter adventoris]